MATEKRLIDATDENIKAILEKVPYYPDEIWKFTAMTKRFPTVDAVEVVRCGGCLYYSETTGKDSGRPCGYGVCTKPFHISNIVVNEDFCSFGQRRADAKMDAEVTP